MSALGTLYVVATPIGNLADLSSRALETLKDVDRVVAEDTRRTGRLLAHHGLKKAQTALHKFNEAEQVERLVSRLTDGESLALVSDGGTPVVSDPGRRLIAGAHAARIRVVPIPGPSAVSAALSVAGFPGERFTFAGFLPARPAGRRKRIEELARTDETIVLFEAPHRIVDALADLADILGNREAVVCRELTKLHEEIIRAPLSDLSDSFAKREAVRGELTIVLAPTAIPGADSGTSLSGADSELAERHRESLALEEGDPRRALRRLSRDLGIGRAELKRRLETLSRMTESPKAPAGTADGRPSVLFLCTGNSCRSQMAEGWARALLGSRLDCQSAGVEPKELDPRAVAVMAEVGIDISRQRSKNVNELGERPFDLVVTVCEGARETCPAPPAASRSHHESFDDPPRLALDASSEEEALAPYRRVRDEIRKLVESLDVELGLSG